jgi:cytochrome c oxidase assembly protein subunit 11
MFKAPSSWSDNRQIFAKLLVIAALMFCFGYALVPLYEKICEITGINVLTNRDPDTESFVKNTQVDTTRLISVEFDANSRGSWHFRPVKSSLQVHPGELVTIVYEIANQESRPLIGQAIPSYAPQQAALYFKKLECFCFKQQDLGPRQTKEFPVVFVIDPKLPQDVKNITLSYTFFEVPGSVKPI